jgi:hypothetical protein
MANLKQRIKSIVRCRWLNTLGLALGMAGVVIIFIWGPPQPDLDPQGKLLLEGPPDKIVEQLRSWYEFMSSVGLGPIGVGFAAQFSGRGRPSESEAGALKGRPKRHRSPKPRASTFRPPRDMISSALWTRLLATPGFLNLSHLARRIPFCRHGRNYCW